MKKFIFQSIKGRNHKKNEDNLLVIDDENYQLFFVFDGVSMSKNSRIAIKISVDFINSFHQNYFVNKDYKLIDLMYDVNLAIIKSDINDAFSTYCAVYSSENNQKEIKISNLGDSRIYLFSQQYIELISRDDNIFPGSSIITKCLGITTLTKSDFSEQTINSDGKRVLICTDGFYKFLEEDKMQLFNALTGSKSNIIKSNLQKQIIGRNKDDSTYILIL